MDMRSRFLLEGEQRELLSRLRRVPGVQAVAAASEPPLGRRSVATEVTIRLGERRTAAYHRISPGYFATLGMPFVSGRDFQDQDALREEQFADLQRNRREGALIVNETAARLFWPAASAIGQHVSTGIDFAVSGRIVVGIVRDTRTQGVTTAPEPEVYAPYAEDPSFAMTFLIRTSVPFAQAWPALRAAMKSVDPQLSTANERTVDEIVNGAFGSARLNAAVVTAFATMALLLSAIGINGILAFSISRRTRELGIRIALGADAQDIRRLLIGETFTSVAAGLVGGVIVTLALTRWMTTILFGVSTHDPASFVGSVVLLLGICVISAYAPVRAASRTDPTQALNLA
jgi:putative ABC transport system permease protein